MKTVKKNVYYCDHCKKKGLAASHIRNHEARCTNNPNRYCGACERQSIVEVVADLKARFTLADNPNAFDSADPEWFAKEGVNTEEKLVTWIGEPVTLQEVRDLADNCPACTLAILRQTGLNRHYFHLDTFEFKVELKEFMKDKMYNGY